MTRARRLALFVGLALLACSRGGYAQLPSTNPFAAPSPLLYQAPDFTRIRNEHFQPAIEEGMRQQLAEVGGHPPRPGAPTFENTILPLERAGQLLARVQRVLRHAHLVEHERHPPGASSGPSRRGWPRTATPSPSTTRLFRRIKSLYDRRESLGLDSLQRLVVERYYRDFVRSGALLSEADKTRLRALNREQASLTNEFGRRLLAATRAGGVVVDDSTQLAGLSSGEIAAAAGAAATRGLTGRWLLPLQNTTQQPAQASLRNRALRQRLFEASTLRADRAATATTRAPSSCGSPSSGRSARRSSGYPTYAAYALDETMAQTPENALRLLTQLARAGDGEGAGRGRGDAAAHRPAARRLPAPAVGLAVLRRAGAGGAVRARRGADQAVLRAEPRAAGRPLLRRAAALRPDLPRAARHPGLPPRRAGLRGVRRRHVAGPLLRRLLQARQQERRRLVQRLRGPLRRCWARGRSSSTTATSPSPPRGSRRCSRGTT